MTLDEFFSAHPQVAVAFSGGVDSSYLLYAARQAGAQTQAYYVRSAFQPRFELEDAQRLAREVGAPLTVLPVDVLAHREVTDNPPDRCYHCKQAIFSAIWQAARADGFSVLLDGTNASDDATDRPGMRALEELGVRSPLRECGLTKDEIRRCSREAGLFTWDKPSYACLATRVPAGTPITADMLEVTERAEAFLGSLGLTDLRVRWLDGAAKIQVPADQMGLVLRERERIVSELGRSYKGVYLDLEARA